MCSHGHLLLFFGTGAQAAQVAKYTQQFAGEEDSESGGTDSHQVLSFVKYIMEVYCVLLSLFVCWRMYTRKAGGDDKHAKTAIE